MKKLKVLLVVFFVLAFFSLFAQSYNGKIVKIERLRRGVVKERPLADVVVSDGQSVVITKSDGSFVLESPNASSFISITCPDGYDLPSFFQEVKADGKPILFKADKVSAKKSRATRFAIVNDANYTPQSSWAGELKQQLFYNEVSFVVFTGTHANLERADLAKVLGVPAFFASSNNVDGFPKNYSFIKGGVHYVFFSELGRSATSSLRWLKDILLNVGRERPTILFTSLDGVKRSGSSLCALGDSLSLNDFNVKAVVDGCCRMNLYEYVGKLTTSTICTAPISSGGVDHSPASFRIVSVNGGGSISTEAVLANVPSSMALVSPSDTAFVDDGKVRFYANVNSSASPIKNVRVGVSKDSVSYDWCSLIKVSPWTWGGFYVVNFNDSSSKYHLRLEAVAESGQTQSLDKTIILGYRKDVHSPSNGVWGNLGGDAGHGAVIDSKFSGKVAHQWTASPQGTVLFSSPVVVDSIVVVSLTNDFAFNKSEFAAFNVFTGKSVWHFFPRAAVKNSFVADRSRVIATDVLGNVYAVDVRTGLPIWQRSLDSLSKEGFFYVGGALTDGIYFTGNSDKIFALNADDGSILWSLGGSGAFNGCESTLTVGGGMLITQNRKGELVGVNARTGAVAWTTPSVLTSSAKVSSSYSGGAFHVVSGNQLFSVRSSDGAIVKTALLPFEVSTKSIPLMVDEVLIAGTKKSGLAAYNLQGRMEWNVGVGPSLVNTQVNGDSSIRAVETSPLKIGGYVVFGASDGFLYVVNAVSGTVIQRINLGAPVLSSFAVVGDRLFVTDLSGNISVFKLM